MRTRTIKMSTLGVLLVAAVALLVSIPALAEPRTPAADEAIQNGPARPQPPLDGEPASRTAPALQGGPVTFDLCASDGSITVGSATVPVWGFVDTGGGPCTTGLVTTLPGPELRAAAGDSVTINLSNALAVPTSILIPGQTLAPSGGAAGLFTTEAPPGGAVSYNFTAQSGTYLYESGTDQNIQVSMGLYGALVVDSATAGQAYGAGSEFDAEAVLLLSEIDPNLNANPAGFSLLDYDPIYWLINGQAYPAIPNITLTAGDRLLLRYLNAGFTHHTMSLLGGYQTVIAKDAFQLTNSFRVVGEIVPAGMTMDTITTPAAPGIIPLYNRNLKVTNGNSFPGGMWTALEVGPGGPPPTPTPVPPTPTPTPALPTPTPLPPTPTPTPLPADLLYFSTLGGGNGNPVPGVAAPYDDADVYRWNGTNFGRLIDGSALGLPGNADIDALAVVDSDTFYMSFNRNGGVAVPTLDVVDDEDVVLYDAGTWSLFFDGDVACGLDNANGQDVDAIDVVGGVLYFSTLGGGVNNFVAGVPGPYDDADIYTWDGLNCGRLFDARSGAGNFLPGNADIDGLTVVDGDTFYMSFNRNLGTNVAGPGLVQDESVVLYDAGAWTMYFDGTAQGLNATDGQDLDAISVP